MKACQLLVFSCLLLLISGLTAAPPVVPPIPKFNPAFKGSGTVTREMGSVNFDGTFTIERDINNLMGLESETFPTPSRTTTNLALLRYDMNKTYYARGDAVNPHCFTEDRNFQGMDSFWEWLHLFARFTNSSMNGKVKYNNWEANVGGVRLELSYPDKPVEPITFYYNRKTIESSVYYTFKNFKMSDAPAAKDFDVPNYCFGR